MSANPLTDHTGYAYRLGDEIGCLQLRNLHSSTATTAVRLLHRQLGNVRGLILDLRDTVGDNFYVAVNTVPLFMSEGTIWSFAQPSRRGLISSTIKLTAEQLAWEGQLPGRETRHSTWSRYEQLNQAAWTILLVNGTNSLAVQVIAQALKLNGAAVVWGSPTCGRAPATFVGVNNGNFLRLVHSQEIHKNGDRIAVPFEQVPPCVPDKDVATDCWDDKLIAAAKQELLRLIARMVPVVQHQPQSKNVSSAQAGA